METLKLEELEEGKVYKCVLSDRNALVISIREEVTEVPLKGDIIKCLVVDASVYNSVTGSCQREYVYDHQLTSLD